MLRIHCCWNLNKYVKKPQKSHTSDILETCNTSAQYVCRISQSTEQQICKSEHLLRLQVTTSAILLFLNFTDAGPIVLTGILSEWMNHLIVHQCPGPIYFFKNSLYLNRSSVMYSMTQSCGWHLQRILLWTGIGPDGLWRFFPSLFVWFYIAIKFVFFFFLETALSCR